MAASQPKIFRDPVHGFIKVPRDTILPVVDTREFQRLRRIRQLGVTSLTYHGGDHSRFSHSLGVYHLFCKVVERLRSIGKEPSTQDIQAAELAALLHDVGHGPFSHALESTLTGKKHEEWTKEIIKSEQTDIHKVLLDMDPGLPERISGILNGSPIALCSHIIASQFDVDRMDYLLRDALATGNSIGRFDLDRVLATLDVNRDQLAFGDQYLAEQFIFARYFAYWQIYFHKTTRGFEKLLQAVWNRARTLYASGKVDACPHFMESFLRGKVSLAEYLEADDYDVLHAIKMWTGSSDRILKDLAARFLYRRPFKCLETSHRPDISEMAKEVVSKRGYSETEYYVFIDTPSNVPYDYYTAVEGEDKQPIFAWDRSMGKHVQISGISSAVRAVAGQRTVKLRVYVPDDTCRSELTERLK